jgi:hypothetical protein
MKKKNPVYRYPSEAEMRLAASRGQEVDIIQLDAPRRKRGRPAGSKNKIKYESKRGPGRPLGSKNKVKRGRPVGSVNKKRRGPGRPKGSKNKPKGRGPGRPPGIHTLSSLAVSSRRDELTRFGTRRVFRNMTHFPKGPRGKPEKKHYWILDLYNSAEKHLGTRISKYPTSKKAAEMEAIDFIGHHTNGAVVRSLTIAGPYKFKPNASTERI